MYDQPFDTVYNALLAVELRPNVLRAIKGVEWDGGNELWSYIWPGWDGENEAFSIQDLRGIEVCENLEALVFNGGQMFTDISPVAKLQKLKRYQGAGMEPTPDLRPLLAIRGLEEVDVWCERNGVNLEVIQQLRARGVKVEARMRDVRSNPE